jgi:hypothetical protein
MFRFDDGRLIITEDGADLEVFHEWFKTFAPSASTIFDAVTSALTTIIFGPDNTQRSISPTQSGFTFWFIVHDFRKRLRDGDLSKDSYRNSELLLRLVRGYPDQSGVVRNDPSLLADVGRMDVSMARAFDFGTGPRLCWFHVEAPANMDYAGLWLRFEYNAHSVKSGALVPRTDLDAGRVFLEGYHAYVLFLRDVVVNGFIDWLTQGYGFRAETSASGLTLRRP